MKRFLTIIIFLFPVLVHAQINPFIKRDPSPAFREGEILNYTVSYSGKIFSTNVADVEMSVHMDTILGHSSYKIIGSGNTRPFFNLFFPLHDVYISWVDNTTLKPYRATSNQKEGGYMYETDFRFDWSKKLAATTGHNIKREKYYRKVLPLEEFSYDALSLFYNLRMVDFSQAQNPGDRFQASLVLEDTVRTLYLKYHGREKRRASKKLGYFNTLKFSCIFATSTDESFQDGTEFFIWMTDDKNKLPVYLESPIKVGKIYATLDSYSGLANPVASKTDPKD